MSKSYSSSEKDLNPEFPLQKSTTLAPPTPWNNDYLLSRKTAVLSLLVLQNASIAILTRLSRIPRGGQPLYNPSTAVFVTELIKLTISFCIMTQEKMSSTTKDHKPDSFAVSIKRSIFDLFYNHRRDITILSVPAALYAIQNTLLYVALSNLDAATYQATYQLKLLTTALFSVVLFDARLTTIKWICLFALTVGVATVQLDGVKPGQRRDPTTGDPKVGLFAILVACISSGLAGAWFEYVLKSPTSTKRPSSTIWARNVQLSIPSIVFAGTGLIASPEWSRMGFSNVFQGFNPLVWVAISMQALGGLLVALVVHEADSVAKGFATSVALVLSTLAGAVFFGNIPGVLFIVGAGLVSLSTIVYALDDTTRKPK